LTKSFVVLMIGNSKSNHFGAQGTFNLTICVLFFFSTLEMKHLAPAAAATVGRSRLRRVLVKKAKGARGAGDCF